MDEVLDGAELTGAGVSLATEPEALPEEVPLDEDGGAAVLDPDDELGAEAPALAVGEAVAAEDAEAGSLPELIGAEAAEPELPAPVAVVAGDAGGADEPEAWGNVDADGGAAPDADPAADPGALVPPEDEGEPDGDEADGAGPEEPDDSSRP